MIRCLKDTRGYMLIEIILAFALAMIIMFFMTELTIKLKNKNDDMLVRTLVSTDQAIIYNTIMKDLYDVGDYDGSKYINCEYINNNFKVDADDDIFTYDVNKNKKFEFKNIVNEYADLKGLTCSADGNDISIVVDIDVPQLKDDFNVYINFNSDDFECDYDYD